MRTPDQQRELEASPSYWLGRLQGAARTAEIELRQIAVALLDARAPRHREFGARLIRRADDLRAELLRSES